MYGSLANCAYAVRKVLSSIVSLDMFFHCFIFY